MVKPGLILPSERMNSICSLTNDGFGSYDDDGNLVLGDNDGKGNGSNVVCWIKVSKSWVKISKKVKLFLNRERLGRKWM